MRTFVCTCEPEDDVNLWIRQFKRLVVLPSRTTMSTLGRFRRTTLETWNGTSVTEVLRLVREFGSDRCDCLEKSQPDKIEDVFDTENKTSSDLDGLRGPFIKSYS